MKNNTIKIEKILKYIFGEIYFLQIKNFFKQFYNKSEFDFVIFTTRRCHVLFCIFNKYFFNSINHEGVSFISDKALHFYDKELENSNCAIVDDILIHGSALKSVFDRVKSKNPKTVQRFVFIQSDEAKFPADYVVERNVDKKTWEKFSNKIVTAIILSSFPYTSYIYSSYNNLSYSDFNNIIFKCKNFCSDYKKSELSLNEVDNKTELNRILEEYIEYYIFDISEYTDLYGLEFSLLRVYYNKFLEICVVIPYCTTNSMKSCEIDEICNYYFNHNLKLPNVKKHETKYRAISTLYSYGLLHYIKQQFALDFLSWSNNENDINMSYYDTYFNEVENVLSSKALLKLNKTHNELSNIFNNYFAHKSNNDCILENDIYKSTFLNLIRHPNSNDSFYDTLTKNDKLSKWFYNFLTKVNILEESYVNNNTNTLPEKQLGLSFEMISQLSKLYNSFFIENKISKFDIFSKIISSADSGFISIFADYYFIIENGEKIKYYSDFLIKGEHVCRLFQNKFIIFISELYKAYLEFSQNYNSKLTFEETIKNLTRISQNLEVPEEIINNINSAYSYIVNSKYKNFINNNVYEDFNDEVLYELYDVGTEIILESDD